MSKLSETYGKVWNIINRAAQGYQIPLIVLLYKVMLIRIYDENMHINTFTLLANSNTWNEKGTFHIQYSTHNVNCVQDSIGK